jgi:hypothetical protein
VRNVFNRTGANLPGNFDDQVGYRRCREMIHQHAVSAGVQPIEHAEHMRSDITVVVRLPRR